MVWCAAAGLFVCVCEMVCCCGGWLVVCWGVWVVGLMCWLLLLGSRQSGLIDNGTASPEEERGKRGEREGGRIEEGART